MGSPGANGTAVRALRMEEPVMQQYRWATGAGLAAVVLWSTTVALARSVSEQLGPLTGAAAVHAVAGTAAVLSFLARPNRFRAVWLLPPKYLVGCGVLFVAYMILLYLGLGLAENRQQALEVGLLNYLWPVLTLLFSAILLRRKTRWTLLPGTLLAMFGIALVLAPESLSEWQLAPSLLGGNNTPRVLGALAAVTWALYSVLTHRWAEAKAQGAVDLFLILTAGLVLPMALAIAEPRDWSPRAVGEAAALGVATYVAYQLWDIAMRRGNVLLVAAASYLTPLLSTLASCAYLAVVPAPRLWWGCLLLVTGSVTSWLAVSARREDASPG